MRYLLVGITLLSQSIGYSQYQSWVGADFSFKPIKKTKIELGIQQRMNGVNSWNRTFLSGKFNYKAFTGISVYGGYRYGISPNLHSAIDLKTITYRHRTDLGIEIEPIDWINKKSRLSFNINGQWQLTQRKFKRDRQVIRTKISVKYDIKGFPLSPFVNWEYFYNKTRDITYMEHEILITGGTAAFRSFGGFAVELPKSQTIKFAVGRRKNYLSNKVNWIIDLNYSLSIK
ncbi:MAG: hypothetical protein RL365_1102 [Bacteroidota bacterium]|jgi:hypothetical protein